MKFSVGVLLMAISLAFTGCGKSTISGQVFVIGKENKASRIAGAQVVILNELQAREAVRNAKDAYDQKIEELSPKLHPQSESFRKAQQQITGVSERQIEIVKRLKETTDFHAAAKIQEGDLLDYSSYSEKTGNKTFSGWKKEIERWRKATKADELDDLEKTDSDLRAEWLKTYETNHPAMDQFIKVENDANREIAKVVTKALLSGPCLAQSRTDADGYFKAEVPNGRIAIIAVATVEDFEACWTLWADAPAKTNLVCSNENIYLAPPSPNTVYTMTFPKW